MKSWLVVPGLAEGCYFVMMLRMRSELLLNFEMTRFAMLSISFSRCYIFFTSYSACMARSTCGQAADL